MIDLLGDRRLEVCVRRSLSIGFYLILLLLALGLLPVTLTLAAIVDLTRDGWRRDRPRWLHVRLLAFFLLYLTCEMAGVSIAAWLWLRWVVDPRKTRAHFLRDNFRLQCRWGSALGRGGLRLFAMRLEIDGEEHLEGGPVILFIRHASVADTILAVLLLSVRHGLRLRYVLKRALLWDPCLDVVGNRLPNRFSRRGSGRREEEIAAVARLADDLGRDEGVLIYPEGTRFSEEKRLQVISSLERRGQRREAGQARELRHVLPPRPGGPLALLATNARSSRADALFCAHRGLEGSTSFRDLRSGALLGGTVLLRFWRVPFAEIPTDEEELSAWLLAQWRRVDAFVGEGRAPQPPAT